MTDWIRIFNEKAPEEAIGEVMESYHNKFVFQTYYLDKIPEYSSFVAALAGDEIVLGVIIAQSIKPIVAIPDIPKPFKRRREDLIKEYKDIMEKFRAVCEAVTIGYVRENEMFQGRPEKIPLIHDLIFLPEKDLIRELHLSKEPVLGYLPLIYSSMPNEEKSLFGYFLESFFKRLNNIFSREELLSILNGMQKDLLENEFERIFEQVNISLKRVLKNE